MRNAVDIIQIILLALCIIMVNGCKPSKNVSFCEGVSHEGKGVKCGKVFTTGDLTMLIKVNGSFGTERIKLKVFDHGKSSVRPIREYLVNVKEEDNRSTAYLSFYNEGKYTVRIFGAKEKELASGDLEIVDTY